MCILKQSDSGNGVGGRYMMHTMNDWSLFSGAFQHMEIASIGGVSRRVLVITASCMAAIFHIPFSFFSCPFLHVFVARFCHCIGLCRFSASPFSGAC